MELIAKLFWSHGPVQSVIVLAATIIFGILLGRIKIFSVSFGIGGILFSGIILGHFGFSLDPGILVFTREFGLILFVYAIGAAVGPTFLQSLKNQGLRLNLMAVFIVLSGALLAVLCFFVFDLSVPQTAGIFSGAVTNTPSLGSANEAWTHVGGEADAVAAGLKVIGMAYAVAYPFGIFGIILTMMLLKGMFHINVDAEIAQLSADRTNRKEFKNARMLLVTRAAVIGKTLHQILPADLEILALKRNGVFVEEPLNLELKLEDRIYVEGRTEDSSEKLAKILGDNPQTLNHPQMLSIFVGIFIGVIVGSIPVFVPGLPTGLRLGVAGGTLLAAIFLNAKQRFCGLVWHMTSSANQLMREIGILLFMACVGLYAGGGFVDTIINGPGLKWMGMGAIITFVPLFCAAMISRVVWGINFPAICGMLAGSMTDPPALAFAMQYYGGDIAASGYSTVYPLTMILRILMGQLLVLGLVAFV